MTTPAADYAAAVAALRSQKLPAYVEYTRDAYARGLAGARDGPVRIVVDTRTGKIVSTTPADDESMRGDTAVTGKVFNPSCYTATGERQTHWNGRDVVAISVRAGTPSCKDDIAVSTVYADAQTLELLGADGSENDDANMAVDFTARYGRFGTYVMPTLVSAHAHGRGWLFWARERAEVRYSNYSFTNERRQAP